MVRAIPSPCPGPHEHPHHPSSDDRHAGRHHSCDAARRDRRIGNSPGAAGPGRALRAILASTGRVRCSPLRDVAGARREVLTNTVIDRQRLAAWIQPRHLDDQALEAYRSAFTTHPARLVIIRDFLAPDVADRLGRFLANEAEFKPEFGLYSIEGAVKEEDWLRADDQDRFFRLGKVVGTPPRFQTSPNALTYLQFRMAFQRPEFKAFFESISGMPLGWSDDFGAHAMAAGDFLRPHSDDNKDRQLALVIYLTPGWKRKFGGVLRVVHHDERFTDVEPEYNSLIAFDVLASPAHLVLPIQPGTAGSTRRLSIGGWYHKLG
ncbi:MAG: hypothetical protein DMD65_07340 [Gemmatimonadetes bacterium]|nr:MAG: hypothetical protein DMD65_07340 [Gemmatimonadota bacterium]